MLVVAAQRGIRRRVSLSVTPDAGATACDIARAVGLSPIDAVYVDGCRFDPETPADELPLRVGSEIGDGPGTTPPDGPAACWASHRSGLAPFHRSPRPSAPTAVRPISVLPAVRHASAGAKFSWAAVIGPLCLAIPMALLVSPRFALFAGLGPILAIGSWAEARRADRRGRQRAAETNDENAQHVAAAVAAARAEMVRGSIERQRNAVDLIAIARSRPDQLWCRLPEHRDFGGVDLGMGAARWVPPVCGALDVDVPIAGQRVEMPTAVRLEPGMVIGVIGPRSRTAALARALVAQLAVDHAPSLLAIEVHAARGRQHAWRWVSWLPHVRDDGRDRADSAADAAADVAPAGDRRLRVGVVDGVEPLRGRAAPGRRLVQERAAAVLVLVPTARQLPANVGITIDVSADGAASVTGHVGDDLFPEVLSVTGPVALTESEASDVARSLASMDDPELAGDDLGLPDRVSLLRCLELDSATLANELGRRWSTVADGGLVARLGVDEHGPIDVDLIEDGPHALIGGTTGSGKSELLRTLVCALAANYGPDRVNLVLIDYKGGSAFDICGDLPHVVGVVSDLDEGMGERALRCLQAELRHRETVLRNASADSIHGVTSLPRLVVVIDEFATLAADLPDFLGALIAIAQRGRSLGVHLVLATQRPAGSVRADLRANTSLRIALRVADPADSSDVIDRPDACHISRNSPGRALVRFGPGEVIRFQSALVTGVTPSQKSASVSAIDVLRSGPDSDVETGERDIDRLVAAACAAHRGPAPRVPWPPPLPDVVDDALDGSWGLVDLPEEQRYATLRADEHVGSVGVFGGATGPLLSVLSGFISDDPTLHVHALVATDLGEAFAASSNLGTVARVSDPVRCRRLLQLFEAQLDTRVPGGDHVAWVLIVDDLDTFIRADGAEHLAVLDRIAATGKRLGLRLIVGGAGEVSGAHRLRGLLSTSFEGATDHHALDEAGNEVVFCSVQFLPEGRVAEQPVRVPLVHTELTRSDLAPADVSATGFRLAIGQSLDSLEPAVVELDWGGRLLVSGSAGSGRSSLLRTIAGQLSSAAGCFEGRVLAVGFDLDGGATMPPTTGLADRLPTAGPETVVLIDDAILWSPDSNVVELLLRPGGPTLVVAERADRIRSAFGHWLHDVRAARTGILLRPDVLDPELLSVNARLDADVRAAGRGLLVHDGRVDRVLVAAPDVAQSSPSERRKSSTSAANSEPSTVSCTTGLTSSS